MQNSVYRLAILLISSLIYSVQAFGDTEPTSGYDDQRADMQSLSCRYGDEAYELIEALAPLKVIIKIIGPNRLEILSEFGRKAMESDVLSSSLDEVAARQFVVRALTRNDFDQRIQKLERSCHLESEIQKIVSKTQKATEFLIDLCKSAAHRSEELRLKLKDCRI